MDELFARIKENVLKIKPSLQPSEEEQNELLNFVIADVVNRAVIFMNRDSLVDAYNEAVEALEEGETLASTVRLPVPKALETVLASTVVQVYLTTQARNNSESGKDIKSISDNGQSITFSDNIVSYLNSSNDSDIFGGTEKLLRRYMLAKIVENTNRYENRNGLQLL